MDSYDTEIWLFTLFWSKSFQAKTAFEADIDCVQEIADFYRFGVHYAKVTFCSKETIIPNPKSVYFVAFVVYQEIQESASYTNSFYSEPLLLNNLFSTMLMLSFLEVVIREVIKNWC